MTRTTYIRDDELGFIPVAEWEERNGKRPVRKTTNIMPDIETFVSPIDGTVISSRPKLRAHNERHGVTNIADYESGYFEKRGKEMAAEASGQTEQAKAERKDLINETLNKYGV